MAQCTCDMPGHAHGDAPCTNEADEVTGICAECSQDSGSATKEE